MAGCSVPVASHHLRVVMRGWSLRTLLSSCLTPTRHHGNADKEKKKKKKKKRTGPFKKKKKKTKKKEDEPSKTKKYT
eukprot:NODE_525_length_2965_cov_42.373502.p7 GENE.NODE_525_length_2965_cov_42.373502~~NODE_525_length_2965_cov_42.373502.p7  ORF type:complete len:77 (+),score=38.17 NODE_525_length_2965_cov_42.373502:2643-2873(+)